MSPESRVRTLGGTAVLLSLTAAVTAGWGSPAWWAVPLLAVVVTISEIAVVHLQFGRQRWTFSLTEGAIAAGFAVGGGAWPMVAVAVGVLAAQTMRRQPRLKLEYNVAQFAAGPALGAAPATPPGPGGAGACAGLGGFWPV